MSDMTRQRLLESIQAGYTDFKQLLAGFDPGQICQPGAIGKWSLKDTVAHIVVHEQRMIEWMKERLGGGRPAMPQPYAMPDVELDRLNEQIYQENRSRSADDVMHDLDKTHEEALRLVAECAEADILDPSRFQLEGGEPLWEAIAANTFWHYEEHGRDIRKWQSACF